MNYLARRLPVAILLGLLLPPWPPVAAAASKAAIVLFSPEGSVKQPQQVHARFATAMVPFGDLRDVAPPFEIDCPAKGVTRWLDATNWVMDFEQPLASGIRCSFRLRAGASSVDGEALAPAEFHFDTGGPNITTTFPTSGDTTIDEQQIFLVGLDGDVDRASVLASAGFRVEGLRERIEPDIVEGAELDGLIKQLSEWWVPPAPRIALRARRAFPNGKAVTLTWGPGVRSPSGLRTDTPQTFGYSVRPVFSAETACRRENAKVGCLPITSITVRFSAPVALDKAQALVLVGPDGVERKPEAPGDDDKAQGFASDVQFKPPFAASSTYTVRMPADLRDDAGRALPAEQQHKLLVKTGPPPVLAKFASRFGILERNAAPALPVTLRNVEASMAGQSASPVVPPGGSGLEKLVATVTGSDLRVASDDPRQILDWLRRVAIARRTESIFGYAGAPAGTVRKAFTLPRAQADADSEVVGIPLETPGLHIVELASPQLGAALLGGKKKMFVQAAALVTNLSVHFKQGRESSLAWVTTLDQAKVVAGARVSIHDCQGKELAAAETNESGIARFERLPDTLPDYSACQLQPASENEEENNWSEQYSTPALSSLSSGLLVVARTSDDMSFVHSSWNRGIESWRFDLPDAAWSPEGPASHTIFDRPLYREGETVHMKHLLREKVLAGFAFPDEARRPTRAAIVHAGSGQRYELPVSFDATGVATQDWTIPAAAKLGSYEVSLVLGDGEIASGSFRIEQFRVPLLRGEIALAPLLEPQAAAATVDVGVHYLSGGPASGLGVLLRSELQPSGYTAPEDYEDFTFAAGPMRIEDEDGSDDGDPSASRPHKRYEAVLDAAGGARIVVDTIPPVDRPTDLVLEAEFRDPNGEVRTVSTSRTLLPSARIPGIRVDDWSSVDALLRPRVVVLGSDGKPAAGAPVRIEMASHDWFSYRKRLVGGFYGYEHSSKLRSLGQLCEGTSNAEGVFECEAAPPERGRLILEAVVRDEAGREARTHTEVWTSGEDSGFDAKPGDRIDLVANKKLYAPEESAKIQVRMPFREGVALVTTEREGVDEAIVVPLQGMEPTVDILVRPRHAPNVFVSVLVVRGRVGDVQPTAMVDLGRPSFKLGIVELKVETTGQKLDVAVSADREVYRARDKAKAHIKVKTADGKAPAAGAEVAVAAVDEGLLEIAPNPSWNLLDAMTGRRPYEVETSTAQSEVLGKRHYGRKASPMGGGGGRSATRELFDTLLLWSPRVVLDAAGEADVEVPLNDSLTSFRIVAVATASSGQFGSGQATIRSTRELSILSGIPPLAREGDRLLAELTLRNTSDAAIQVRSSGTVEASAGSSKGEAGTAQFNGETSSGQFNGKTSLPLAEQQVSLAPGEGRVVTWPVTVPSGRRQLAYTLNATATAAGATLEDSLRIVQKVVPANRVQVTQSTLEQVDGSLAFPVKIPAGASSAAAGSGITVDFAASLAGNVASIKDWLADYRYKCLEQLVSVAIGREDDAAWKAIVDGIEPYIDGSGLLRYFPGSLPGDDRLTAYVLSISVASGRPLPPQIADRLVGGLRGFVDGRVLASGPLALPDATLRKLAAISALALAGKAEPAMLETLVIHASMWPTSAVLDWWTILLALPADPVRDKLRADADKILRARTDLSGTTLDFAGPAGMTSPWWMMASPDSDGARLLLLLARNQLWKADAPRLLRAVLGRRHHGAWSTTVANAWGVVAMRAFEKAFETETVSGTSEVRLGDASAAVTWPEVTPQLLPWPPQTAELRITHTGSGKPWATTTARAAVPLSEPVAAGYRIRKSVTPLEGSGAQRRRGDRLLVRIDIDAQRAMSWVVVDDPIPAGASHLASTIGMNRVPSGDERCSGDEDCPASGTGAAGDARLQPSWAEKSMEAWRGYFDYLPAGHSVVEYAIRLNQAGTFQLPPTRVEALYAPEIHGDWPNQAVTVAP